MLLRREVRKEVSVDYFLRDITVKTLLVTLDEYFVSDEPLQGLQVNFSVVCQLKAQLKK